MSRRHNFQTVSWFNDLYRRKLLELDPPYQRRSVWNQRFKDYFIDTVLLAYPAPAIFLFEEISPDGVSLYNVVDGKQRLTTILEFIRNEFPVSEDSPLERLRGRYFESFDDNTKKEFWSYQFLVEYLPDKDERVINDIFDRINRNVAKLTPQELRHAKLDGLFITAAENLAAWMQSVLPRNVPRLDPQSRKQMKDVELAAILLLLLESGVASHSQADLDRAFTERDEVWEGGDEVEELFRSTIHLINTLMGDGGEGQELAASRLRNQTDFYSLVGALAALLRERRVPDTDAVRQRLLEFLHGVDDAEARERDETLFRYYQAARSASNDKGPREARIRILQNVIAPADA